MNQSRLVVFVQRHERRLIVLWLLGCLVALLSLGLFGLRLGGVDAALRVWDRHWLARLEVAQELVEAEQYEEALPRLERLDRGFPAIWVKHRYASHRERILDLLGRVEAELGHAQRAIDAHERLVELDPRNWRNHFSLAETCRRFGECARARTEYAEVLAIHPSHLPSLEAQIEMRLDSLDFATAPKLYESYLDAWLLAPMELELGSETRTLDVPVDGRTHTIEVVVDAREGWGGELKLSTKGYSVRVDSLEILEPMRIGVARTPGEIVFEDAAAWSGQAVEAVGEGAWAALGTDARLVRRIPDEAVARIRCTLTAFKAMSASLWSSVARSYLEVGDTDGLEAARRRTLVGGCLEAGSVFPGV